jgi:hypothetical protein
MNVNLHIERLVLDGVDIAPHQRYHLRAAVQAELARLMSVGGLAGAIAGGGAVPNIPGQSIQLQRQNSPGELGRQIAGAVYGGIGSK